MATIVRDPATLSRIERWVATLDPGVDPQEAITAFLAAASAAERASMRYAWNSLWSRPSQRLPADDDWDTWFVRAGRGWGKTRCGSEGVRKLVESGQARSVTIIGPTAAATRDVMIEGPESGILAVHPPNVRPTYEASKRLLTWPNGALGHIRSAEEPDSIIGLNSDLVLGDEPSAWKSGVMAWDAAQLGNRIGIHPHSILTGTPRPIQWLRDLEKEPTTRLSTGSTYDNIANLAPSFIRLILGRYEGTRLGQQELHALYLEDVEGALWTMAVIEATRIMLWQQDAPWLSLTAGTDLEHRMPLGLGAWRMNPSDARRKWVTWVGVDPPGETAECGIIVATAPEHGRAGHDHCIVLDDMSVAGPPEVWGSRVVEATRKWHAEGVVVEKNQGGDMTRSTIHAVDPNVKVEKISARESKSDRAEPVSTLHAKGWIHHYGHLPLLESQQSTWVKGDAKSPDRLDAMVHVVTKLLRFTNVRGATVHSPI